MTWILDVTYAKKEKPLKRVTITVDPDDYEAVDRLARSGDVSASWLIRRSMREFLQRYRGESPDPIGQEIKSGKTA